MTILSLLFLALNLENIKLSKYNYSFVYFSMSYLVFSIIYLFRPYLIKNLFPTVAFLIGDEKNDEIKRQSQVKYFMVVSWWNNFAPNILTLQII